MGNLADQFNVLEQNEDETMTEQALVLERFNQFFEAHFPHRFSMSKSEPRMLIDWSSAYMFKSPAESVDDAVWLVGIVNKTRKRPLEFTVVQSPEQGWIVRWDHGEETDESLAMALCKALSHHI